MLTIFTSPKPFQGPVKITQINAIRSWMALRPACEIILFGDDAGTAETAAELRVLHVPDIACSDRGTPLISAMFEKAQEIAVNPLMCYVNADIIFISDFLPAIQRVSWPKFLITGRRWDIEIRESIDFEPGWEKALRDRLPESGKLHSPTAIDYFVFPHGQYRDIPPLVVGRAGWDAWMIYRARSLKIPVIDATQVITAVHQNHDYSHFPGGVKGVWQGTEAKQNRRLIGGYNRVLNIQDATWQLTETGLRRTPLFRYIYRSAARWKGSLSRLIKKPESIW